MARFLAGRIARLVITFFALTGSAFALIKRMPIDLCTSQLGFAAANKALMAQCRAQNLLDKPAPIQYLNWLGRFVRGDLGTDRSTGQPMLEFLARKLFISIELLAISVPISVVLGTALGLYMASKQRTKVDGALSAATLAMVSTPAMVLGSVLPLILSVQFRWLPVQGLPPLDRYPIRHLQSLVMPVLVLAVAQIPLFARVVRAEAIATLQADFIDVARGKGLRKSLVLRRHVLRPSAIPLATVTATYIGEAVSGVILVERIFRLNGLGTMFVGAITARSSFMLMTLITLSALVWVVVAALLEVLYLWLDPRLARTG